MDCSLPGSSVQRISQARILDWVAVSFSRRSSRPRGRTHISCIARQILYQLIHLGSLQVMSREFLICACHQGLLLRPDCCTLPFPLYTFPSENNQKVLYISALEISLHSFVIIFSLTMNVHGYVTVLQLLFDFNISSYLFGVSRKMEGLNKQDINRDCIFVRALLFPQRIYIYIYMYIYICVCVCVCVCVFVCVCVCVYVFLWRIIYNSAEYVSNAFKRIGKDWMYSILQTRNWGMAMLNDKQKATLITMEEVGLKVRTFFESVWWIFH